MRTRYEDLTEKEYTANVYTRGANVRYKVIHEARSIVIRCSCGLIFRDPKAQEKFRAHNMNGTHSLRMTR